MAEKTFEMLVRQGDEEAAAAIIAMAEAGHPDALFQASEFKLRGIAGDIDMGAAKSMMDRAASLGHGEARRAQAYYLAAGLGSKPDFAGARALLENMADEDRFVAVQLAFLDQMQCRSRLATANRQILSADPHVEVVQSLFSREECRYILTLAKPWLEPARVYSQAGGSRLDPMRDAHNMAFQPAMEDLVIQSINQCIADAAKLPVEWGEPLTVMHYLPGQQFRPHHDSHGPGSGKRIRIATALLYLNDEYEGGETHFPNLGFRIRGAVGDLLIFHNVDSSFQPDPKVVHAGLPVLRGEKWLATRWIIGTSCFRR